MNDLDKSTCMIFFLIYFKKKLFFKLNHDGKLFHKNLKSICLQLLSQIMVFFIRAIVMLNPHTFIQLVEDGQYLVVIEIMGFKLPVCDNNYCVPFGIMFNRLFHKDLGHIYF